MNSPTSPRIRLLLLRQGKRRRQVAPVCRAGARPPAAAAHPELLSWHLPLSVCPPLPRPTPQPQDAEERAGNPEVRPAPDPPSPCSLPFSGCQEGLLSAPPPRSLPDLPDISGVTFPPARGDGPGSGPRLPGLVRGLAAWFQAEKQGARACSQADCTVCRSPAHHLPLRTVKGAQARPPFSLRQRARPRNVRYKAPSRSSWLPVNYPAGVSVNDASAAGGSLQPRGLARAGPERCWHGIVNTG